MKQKDTKTVDWRERKKDFPGYKWIAPLILAKHGDKKGRKNEDEEE